VVTILRTKRDQEKRKAVRRGRGGDAEDAETGRVVEKRTQRNQREWRDSEGAEWSVLGGGTIGRWNGDEVWLGWRASLFLKDGGG